jgi:hypothetical protein
MNILPAIQVFLELRKRFAQKKKSNEAETHFMITHIITSYNYVGIKMQCL